MTPGINHILFDQSDLDYPWFGDGRPFFLFLFDMYVHEFQLLYVYHPLYYSMTFNLQIDMGYVMYAKSSFSTKFYRPGFDLSWCAYVSVCTSWGCVRTYVQSGVIPVSLTLTFLCEVLDVLCERAVSWTQSLMIV